MYSKLTRSITVLFHVPLCIIVIRMLFAGSSTLGHSILIFPFIFISLGLAAFLTFADNTRDEYYPTLLLLGVYDLMLYYYILS